MHSSRTSCEFPCGVSPPQAMNKVKVSDKFRFPLELDLGAYLPPELAAQSAQYDLTAILIHKGTSASHGHYGALPCLPRSAHACSTSGRGNISKASSLCLLYTYTRDIDSNTDTHL